MVQVHFCWYGYMVSLVLGQANGCSHFDRIWHESSWWSSWSNCSQGYFVIKYENLASMEHIN